MNGYKPKSTTKEARQIILDEIIYHYCIDFLTKGIAPALQQMRQDAESYNCGDMPTKRHSDWQKGMALVDAGCFRCWKEDQADFLRKIYGDSVDKWSGIKVHKVYASLIGREYARLCKRFLKTDE